MEEENPSMKSHQVDEKVTNYSKLQKQLQDLQQDWDLYKQSNPKTKRRRQISYSFTMVKNLDLLLDTSPRHLMSSLQQEGKVMRSNDLVMEEIRRERRAAIESGKLKGRRLFQGDHEKESEVRSVSGQDSNGDDKDDSGKSKEITVCFQGCSKSSSSSSCWSAELKEEKRVGEKIEGGKWGRKCMVMFKLWLAIGTLVFGICFIRGFAEFENEYEVILVPT